MKNNNLVSKNPVQRFKEGKNIFFLDKGGKPWASYYTVGNWPKSESTAIRVSKQKKQNNNSTKITAQGQFNRQVTAGKINPQELMFRPLDDGRGNLIPIDNSNSTKTPKPDPTGKRTVTKKVSTPVSTPVNYGLVGGVQKGWKGQKGVIDDESFANLQSLGYSGERNAQAAQQWMKDNLSKYGIHGSVATDNAWGEQSSRALKMMMQNKANNNSASVFGPLSNPLYSINDTKTMITQQTPSIDEQAAFNAGNNPNLRFTPTIFNFNRAQTRDWLRQNFGSAYSLTGAQRAAVRNVLGGRGTDYDRNLIGMNQKLFDLMKNKGYFKKGGLISKSPIERFKQKLTKINF